MFVGKEHLARIEQRYVPEYWYVDLQADRIEIYDLESDGYGVPRILRRGDVLTSNQVPGFELAVDKILGQDEQGIE